MTPVEASLIADYLAFQRHRRQSRPLALIFAGFALMTLAGGALGTVPRIESLEAAASFIVLLAGLWLLNAWRWSRLRNRLAELRAARHQANS